MPVVWAQAMAEYGAMAVVTSKLSSAYTQIELSLRTDTETWLIGGGVIGLGLWLFRRK